MQRAFLAMRDLTGPSGLEFSLARVVYTAKLAAVCAEAPQAMSVTQGLDLNTSTHYSGSSTSQKGK
jgi:hypothetical protein